MTTSLREVCDTLETERRITEKAITDLIAAGFTVSVNDGEDTTLKHSTDTAAILAAMWSTNEDWLIANRDGKQFGWIRMVHGNGWCVISDYTMNLESYLSGANALADTLQD